MIGKAEDTHIKVIEDESQFSLIELYQKFQEDYKDCEIIEVKYQIFIRPPYNRAVYSMLIIFRAIQEEATQ